MMFSCFPVRCRGFPQKDSLAFWAMGFHLEHFFGDRVGGLHKQNDQISAINSSLLRDRLALEDGLERWLASSPCIVHGIDQSGEDA